MTKRDPRSKDLRKRRAELQKKRETIRKSADSSPNYVRFEHPKKLFDIVYPAHWKEIIEDDGSIGFAPQDRSDVVIWFYGLPFSIDTKLLTESPNFEPFMTALFMKVGSDNPRRDPTIVHPCMTAKNNDKGQGGQRWIVAEGDTILGITTLFPDSEQHIWRPIFERMLSSFRINRGLEGLFVRVITYLKSKLATLRPHEKFNLEGHSLRGDKFELPLGNLMAQVKRCPEDYQELADAYLETTLATIQLKNLGMESWQEAEEHILPILKSADFVQQVGEEQEQAARDRGTTPCELVAAPWLADLVICYVVHRRPGFRLIHDLDLERWNIDEDALHERAMRNLAARDTPEIVCANSPDGDETMGLFRAKESLESSYLLLPNIYNLVAPVIGEEIVAAIPSRDALVVFSDNPARRGKIRDVVAEDFKTTDYPLSDRLFSLTPDGIALA